MTVFVAFLLVAATLMFLAYPLLKPAEQSGLDDIEAEVARRRKQTAGDRRVLTCSKCGANYLPGDRFCQRCGSKLGLRSNK